MDTTETSLTPRFLTRQAAEVLGLSYRGLDQLVRRRIVFPSVHAEGIGTTRLWSVADIVAVAIGHEWVKKGVAWGMVQRLAHFIKSRGLEGLGRTPVLVVTDDRVSAVRADTAVKVRPGQHVLMCDLRPGTTEIVRRLAKVLEREQQPEREAAEVKQTT